MELSPTSRCWAGSNGFANAINHGGQIAGECDTPGGPTNTTFWPNPTTVQNLGTLGGCNSTATALNDDAIAVSYSDTVSVGKTSAAIWKAQQIADLNLLLQPSSPAQQNCVGPARRTPE